MKTQWIKIFGEYRERWWLRPICWLFKHQPKAINLYGVMMKQCKRCGKYFWNKKAVKKEGELTKVILKGEIGQLYGVKFKTTTFTKGVKLNKAGHFVKKGGKNERA